jgi:type II secretory pathway pseudopilin PulG
MSTRFVPTAARGAGSARHRMLGVTLIELSVVLLIVTLLLGSILVPLATQMEQRRLSDAEKQLAQIQDALIGYALAYGYLPCPDKTTAAGAGTMNDGQEDVKTSGTVGECQTQEGNLPWVTLGLANFDPWGNRYLYRVHSNFSPHPPLAPPTMVVTSDLRVCRQRSCATADQLTNTSDGPIAVVVSRGKNRGLCASAGTCQDENENTDGDIIFVSREVSGVGAASGEFDDVVIWLPRSLFLSRMVSGGKLP